MNIHISVKIQCIFKILCLCSEYLSLDTSIWVDSLCRSGVNFAFFNILLNPITKTFIWPWICCVSLYLLNYQKCLLWKECSGSVYRFWVSGSFIFSHFPGKYALALSWIPTLFTCLPHDTWVNEWLFPI